MNYPLAVDIVILTTTILIGLSYFVVTTMVEYCQGPGSIDGTTSLCRSVLGSSSVMKLFQSNALILTLYAVNADYILGLIMFLAFLTVPKVQKALERYEVLYINKKVAGLSSTGKSTAR